MRGSLPSSFEEQLKLVRSSETGEDTLVELVSTIYEDVAVQLAKRDSLPHRVVVEADLIWRRGAFRPYGYLVRNTTLSDRSFQFLTEEAPKGLTKGLLLNPKISGPQWLLIVTQKPKLPKKTLKANAGKVTPHDIDMYLASMKEANRSRLTSRNKLAGLYRLAESETVSAESLMTLVRMSKILPDLASVIMQRDNLPAEALEQFFEFSVRRGTADERFISPHISHRFAGLYQVITYDSFDYGLLLSDEAMSNKSLKEYIRYTISESFSASREKVVEGLYVEITGDSSGDMLPEWKKHIVAEHFSDN